MRWITGWPQASALDPFPAPTSSATCYLLDREKDGGKGRQKFFLCFYCGKEFTTKWEITVNTELNLITLDIHLDSTNYLDFLCNFCNFCKKNHVLYINIHYMFTLKFIQALSPYECALIAGAWPCQRLDCRECCLSRDMSLASKCPSYTDPTPPGSMFADTRCSTVLGRTRSPPQPWGWAGCRSSRRGMRPWRSRPNR